MCEVRKLNEKELTVLHNTVCLLQAEVIEVVLIENQKLTTGIALQNTLPNILLTSTNFHLQYFVGFYVIQSST